MYGDYPSLDHVEKILVIKLRHLGDVLLSTPVIRSLKHRFPKAQIDAYIYKEAKPMLEGHFALRQCIVYDRAWKKENFFSRIVKEWALLKKIRREKYDLVINLTEGDRGGLAALISGAPVRVGFTPKGAWQKKWLTHLVKQTPSPRHTVEKDLDALRKIGINPPWEERELDLHIPSEVRAQIKNKIGPEPFILIHPASRWRFKCWPVQKMRQLAQELIKGGQKLIFTSGPDAVEMEMVREIVCGLDVLDLSGKVTLKELAALIDLSSLLVCVDSVPFHMASALKKKVIALFGPTSEITWGPWRNPDAHIVASAHSCRPCYQDGCGGSKISDCLVNLSVQKVLHVIQSKLLEKVIYCNISL